MSGDEVCQVIPQEIEEEVEVIPPEIEEEVKVIPLEIEKIVVATDVIKDLLKTKYGREVEKIEYDVKAEMWIIDFVMPGEAESYIRDAKEELG